MAILPITENSNAIQKVYIFSDGGTGINKAIDDYLPLCYKKRCSWHITLKFYKNETLKGHFWDYVNSTNDTDRQRSLMLMQTLFPSEFNEYIKPYLSLIVQYEKDNTWGYNSNSICESLNSMFQKVKHSNPFLFFETFVFKSYEIIENMKDSMKNEAYIFTNHIIECMNKSKEKAAEPNVLKIKSSFNANSIIYRIYDSKKKCEYMVNTKQHTCTCNQAYRGYPCSHLLFVKNQKIHDFELINDKFKVIHLQNYLKSIENFEIPDSTNLQPQIHVLPEIDDQRKSKKRQKSAGIV